MNATLHYFVIPLDETSMNSLQVSRQMSIGKAIRNDKLDFYLNGFASKGDFVTHNYIDWCYLAPLPAKFSIYELILILPLDRSCWMWLGISVGISAIIWSMKEGFGTFWDVSFRIFRFSVLQSTEIKT